RTPRRGPARRGCAAAWSGGARPPAGRRGGGPDERQSPDSSDPSVIHQVQIHTKSIGLTPRPKRDPNKRVRSLRSCAAPSFNSLPAGTRTSGDRSSGQRSGSSIAPRSTWPQSPTWTSTTAPPSGRSAGSAPISNHSNGTSPSSERTPRIERHRDHGPPADQGPRREPWSFPVLGGGVRR